MLLYKHKEKRVQKGHEKMSKREKVARQLYKVMHEQKDNFNTTLSEDDFVKLTLEGCGVLRPASMKQMTEEIAIIRNARA